VNKYLFDVDGTLTPSRGKMNVDFSFWFANFCTDHDVYLVTGSDRAKTIEQIGEYIYGLCKRVYQCSGSDVYEGDVLVRSSEWCLPDDAREWLERILEQSQFAIRTGLHVEERPGMVNFSVVGRNANLKERAEYVAWDQAQNERNEIAQEFNYHFPDIVALPGGETGIDISPRGCDKSQILIDFSDDDMIHFFGDRMDEDGNDYPLASKLFNEYSGVNYHVKDWRDTWTILKTIP